MTRTDCFVDAFEQRNIFRAYLLESKLLFASITLWISNFDSEVPRLQFIQMLILINSCLGKALNYAITTRPFPPKIQAGLKAEINPVLFNFPLEALAAFALVIMDVKGTKVYVIGTAQLFCNICYFT